jgi:hypothetical protein
MSRFLSISGLSIHNQELRSGIKVYFGQYPKISIGKEDQEWIPIGTKDSKNLIKDSRYVRYGSIISRKTSDKKKSKYLVVKERNDDTVIVKWKIPSLYRGNLGVPTVRNAKCYGFKKYRNRPINTSYIDMLVSFKKGGSILIDRTNDKSNDEKLILTWNGGNNFIMEVMENNEIVSRRKVNVVE